MDILFVGPIPPFPGGAAVVNAGVLVGLAGRGHVIRAVGPIREDATEDLFAARHPKIRTRRVRLPRYFIGANPLPSDGELRQEAEAIRGAVQAELAVGRPDALLLGREWNGTSILDLLLARKIPFLVVVHGASFDRLVQGSLPEQRAEDCRRVFRLSHNVIAVARHLGAKLAELGFSNSTVIENSVDLAQFRPLPKSPALLAELGIAADDIVVGHFSNLKTVKRPLDIVQSAGRALAIHPKLLYLVNGDGLLRRDMEEACARAGISGRFRFPGWVDHDRVPEYLNLADMVVMPSELEGLSLTCLEAQACGRTLIASDIPASLDLIEDGVTGLLFRMGDVEDLTAKTLLAAGDPALRERIGRNAVEARVRAGGIGRMIDAYERALLGAVDRLT